ncbi:universal stress protein [Tropicimonas sp. S265A]|uniref:universal stress protein n=1 Tax=Tropicimonas sp. S265A TaxID=3415134 RepID=UPI003C7A530E
MSIGLLKPARILAVADHNDDRIALESAITLAKAHRAALDVIACVEPPHELSILSRLAGAPPDRLIENAVEQTREALRARLDELASGQEITLQVTVGKGYLEVIRHVALKDCDLVLKAAEPLQGINRFLFASTDQHLLRKCPCPVWLQRKAAPKHPKRILATVDLDVQDAPEPETLTALNRRVLDAAVTIAGEHDAEIIVLHAWDAIGEGMIWAFSNDKAARLPAENYVNEILFARKKAMNGFLADVRNDIGPEPALVPLLVRGTPEAVISENARKLGVDTIVMGTVARTGLSGVFIGNTAENIINSIECSVLAVKPEGFVSPILR